MKLYTENGAAIYTSSSIGLGAEAEIYNIHGNSDIVAKIYKTKFTDNLKEEKLKYMINHYPEGSMQNPLYVNVRGETKKIIVIAWPLHLLYDAEKNFIGYIMPKIDYCTHFTRFARPQIRNNLFGNLTQKNVAIVAKNIAKLFESLHQIGCLICDSNESNYLIDSNGFVIMIDTDSFQIETSNGKVFNSNYFTPENSPLEYQSGEDIKFTKEGDRFILSVFIFKLLMGGCHPFCGRPLPRSGVISTQDIEITCIKKGWFPYESNKFILPPRRAPEYLNYQPIRDAFHNCFVKGHRNSSLRPSAKEWIDILEDYTNSADINKVSNNNTQASSLKVCPFVLVMDVTPSLIRYYNELQNGYELMIDQLKKLDTNNRIEYLLVEFADPPEITINFSPISEIQPHKIKLRGNYTNIGSALLTALDELEVRMMYYTNNDISFYKPIILLMTDGNSTHTDEVEKIPLAAMRSRKYDVHTVFVGDLSLKEQNIRKSIVRTLTKLSTTATITELKNMSDFTEFFKWISLSVGTTNKKIN